MDLSPSHFRIKYLKGSELNWFGFRIRNTNIHQLSCRRWNKKCISPLSKASLVLQGNHVISPLLVFSMLLLEKKVFILNPFNTLYLGYNVSLWWNWICAFWNMSKLNTYCCDMDLIEANSWLRIFVLLQKWLILLFDWLLFMEFWQWFLFIKSVKFVEG